MVILVLYLTNERILIGTSTCPLEKMTPSASYRYVTLYCNYAGKTTYIDRGLELRNYLLRRLGENAKGSSGRSAEGSNSADETKWLRTKQNGCVLG